jgi:ketosteroid isomerase-like protein
MTRIAFLSAIFACACCAAGEEAAVEAAERAWGAGVVKNDFAALEKVMSDDLYYSHSNGLVDTKRSYIDNLKSGKARYTQVEYDDIKVTLLSKDIAIAAIRARVTTINNGQPNPMKMALLHVFQKKGGQWQLRAHQSARLTN